MRVKIKTSGTGTRKGKAMLLSIAYKNGLTAKVEDLDPNAVKFATNSEGYYAMVKAEKIPKCFLTGRTCSNEHYLGLVDGNWLPIGISVGQLAERIYTDAHDPKTGKVDEKKVKAGIDKAVADEKAEQARRKAQGQVDGCC